MGFGDVKLAGALGLMLGLEQGAWMLAIAAFSGAVWGVVVARLQPSSPKPMIPFGLFLALCGGGLILTRIS